jgi:hypothetical protein
MLAMDLFCNRACTLQVNPKEETEVALMICRDNETRLAFQARHWASSLLLVAFSSHFHIAQEAILPVTLTEHSYTILDTSEGAVFLHVNHKPFHENAYAGHVYTSDWSGLYYSLSVSALVLNR